MHMYSTYVQYVVDACLSRPPAGGQWTWRNGMQGKEDISGCWREKGRAILQSNPTQHALKKRGKERYWREGLPTSFAIKQNMPGSLIVSP